MLELNEIYCMDCLDGMKQLDNESVDLVVTSPPYDNLRQYNGYSFDFENVAKELYRVTKQGGVVVWIVNDATKDYSESGTSFRQALGFIDIGFKLFDTMIWCKDGGGAVGSNLSYTQNFEYMFVLSKGKPKSVNLICDKKNLSFGKKDGCLTGRRNANGEHKSEIRNHNHEYSRRNNWWRLVPQAEEGSSFHPAVFPEILVRDHIISWSNEGDIVLDPFMGSGTTARVARKLNRHFVGFELNPEYCKIIEKKIQVSGDLFY